VNLALLVFILIPFVPESIVRPRNGARRWINVGSLDLQPSELLKLTWIVAMAAWLRTTATVKRFGGVVAAIAVTAIPFLLIAMQPDLDSALLFWPGLMVMLLAAGARIRHLVIVACIATVLAPCSYPLLKKHQKDRIQAMIAHVVGDTRLDDGIGFQGNRSITLAAAGGVAGAGREEAGTLIRFNHLPEEHTDMVFSVVCCRWGLFGGLAVWALSAAYAFGAFMVGARAGTMFGRLVAVGLGTNFFLYVFVNVAMVTGSIPVGGVPLPLISHGGSAMLTTMLGFGVLLSVYMHRDAEFGPVRD